MPAPRSMARLQRKVINPVMRHVAGRIPVMSLVVHVGRRSGREYRTPVDAFRDGDTVRIAIGFGRGSDWVHNVLAAGHFQLVRREGVLDLVDPVVRHDPENRWAPALGRPILRLARIVDHLEARVDSHDLG